MRVYVYIDESGSIHKNSKTKYFAVGGYITYEEDKNKIISKYKRNNLEIKKSHSYKLDREVKSFDMNIDEKIKIFTDIANIKTFCGFAIVFNKEQMKKEIVESNIFFNYAVRLIFQDCIFPILEDYNIDFKVSVDNRNIKVGNLKNLEDYLNTEFCLKNVSFNVTYYDSKTNFGIQLADLIVNTFYNYYKDIKIVDKIFNYLNYNKFRITLFPKYKIIGRKRRIIYKIKEFC